MKKNINKDSYRLGKVKFIYGYYIYEDKIYICYDDGSVCMNEYSKENEIAILEEMKKQINCSDNIEKTNKRLRNFDIVMTNVSSALSAGNIALAATTSQKPIVSIGISLVFFGGIIFFGNKLLERDSNIDEVQKYKYYIKHGEELKRLLKNNFGVPIVTINDIKDLSMDDLKYTVEKVNEEKVLELKNKRF